MQYIPNSRIQMEEASQVINETRLPDELNAHIISFLPQKIDVNGDENIFWTELGIETCNLDRWSWYCFDILQQSFGKTYTKSIGNLHCELFIHLRGKLDSLICWNYPQSVHSIRSIYGDEVPITHVFYRSDTINEYDVTYFCILGRKWKKSITSRDKIYIETFLERMNVYLDYLEANVNHFPINNVYGISKQTRKSKINEIINCMKKMKKIVDKMSAMIVDISIEE